MADGRKGVKARIVAVVAEGTLSNLGRDIQVTSEAVMEHMAQRISFVDPGFDMEVFTDKQLQVPSLYRPSNFQGLGPIMEAR